MIPSSDDQPTSTQPISFILSANVIPIDELLTIDNLDALIDCLASDFEIEDSSEVFVAEMDLDDPEDDTRDAPSPTSLEYLPELRFIGIRDGLIEESVEIVELSYEHMGSETKLVLCLRGTRGAEVYCEFYGPGIIDTETRFLVGIDTQGEAKFEVLINRYGKYTVVCSNPAGGILTTQVNVTSAPYASGQ